MVILKKRVENNFLIIDPIGGFCSYEFTTEASFCVSCYFIVQDWVYIYYREKTTSQVSK